MRIRHCGVRGSTPAPGADFVEVGGNTSCVAVWRGSEAHPCLILDAGTGIRSVTSLLGGEAFAGTILLTHLHWDHVQGLPFFAAGDREDSSVRLLMPSDGPSALDLLRGAMSPPHFPIGPEGLCGQWTFDVVSEGVHEIGGLEVTAARVPHKGGRTFGFRVTEAGGGSVAYLPDHRPAAAGSTERRVALDLADHVDVLIHDAQFLDAEDAIAEDYGHATVEQAVAFAAEAGAGELVLFHHGPARTDAQVHAIGERFSRGSVRVSVAREGREHRL